MLVDPVKHYFYFGLIRLWLWHDHSWKRSQSLLLLVSGTGTLIAAACGIEVISHRERYAVREAIAVFAGVDISTIESPPFAVAFSQVIGLEIEY